ncbi:MAG TPA: hypothetical protein VGL44_03435 [Gaiellales bacterium]
MSGERIRLQPDASPEEAEAVHQALAALGLIEGAPGEGEPAPEQTDREP